MNGRTHTAAGLACSVTAAALVMPQTLTLPGLVLGSAAAVTAATLPDCDQYEHNMKAAVHCLIQLIVFCILAQWLTKNPTDWQYAVFFIAAIFVGAVTEHRSATHSIAALFGFSWMFGIMIGDNQELTFWFFLSYASHLILDILNKRGEMLFWPFRKERFCLKLSRSESRLGKLIFKAASVWYAIVLVWILFRQYGGMLSELISLGSVLPGGIMP